MPDLVEVAIEDARWHGADLTGLAQKFCAETLTHFGYRPDDFEIGLLGCDDAKIAELNSQFREKPTATNVLSWPSAERASEIPGQNPPAPMILPNGRLELGDIAISYDVCLNEAEQAGKPFERHVGHLLVHATLHLLGYDHILTADAQLMEEIERQVLASMGLPDPYGDEQRD